MHLGQGYEHAKIAARFARAEVDGWAAVEPKREPKPVTVVGPMVDC
jgi:hypothetical protein